ncbi:MAG: ABC transporter permease [Planctomycetaceae bacterium]
MKPESRTVPLIRIRPAGGLSFLNVQELWQYRELLYFLTWRDIKVRYKQTLLGAAWAVVQPVMMMVVFSLVFGRFAGLGDRIEGGIPYPVYTFAALLPWNLFATALTQSSNSLINNEHLITKVYFPRVFIPLSSILAGLVDFAIAFTVLALMMIGYALAGYDLTPGWGLLCLPLFVVLAITAAFAVGLWLSALNVQFRDVRYTLAFLAQFWLFATPVAYPLSIVPERWRMIYGLNPMVGVVEGFRWALFGQEQGTHATVFVSVGIVAALLTGGLFYFQRMEQTFSDVI